MIDCSANRRIEEAPKNGLEAWVFLSVTEKFVTNFTDSGI